MGKAAIEVVHDLYGAFGRGDVEAILGMLADDVDWHFVGPEEYPAFGRRKGREGALAFFQALGANEDISEFAPTRFLTCGDTVVVHGRAALTLKKTGRAAAYDWVHIWDVTDGRIAAFQGFVDSAAVLDAYRG